jgi:catechol 2,3-dioxygenase-like lactoylglutathione lyase family enzyme
MKRLHVHIAVDDLTKSIGFYSTLFGAPPSVLKSDYAKWMLDDPKVNLAISQRKRIAGIDHLGIQVDSDDELRELASRLKAAGEQTRDQEATTCCYAQSNKAWVNDPSGVRWETFYTFGEATTYGEDAPGAEAPQSQTAASACCPLPPKAAEVCCATLDCG